MNIIPNPQREWLVVFCIGLGMIGYSVWSSTALIDRVVSGTFTPDTTLNKTSTKPFDEVIRAGAILDRLSPPPLEQLEVEG